MGGGVVTCTYPPRAQERGHFAETPPGPDVLSASFLRKEKFPRSHFTRIPGESLEIPAISKDFHWFWTNDAKQGKVCAACCSSEGGVHPALFTAMFLEDGSHYARVARRGRGNYGAAGDRPLARPDDHIRSKGVSRVICQCTSTIQCAPTLTNAPKDNPSPECSSPSQTWGSLEEPWEPNREQHKLTKL